MENDGMLGTFAPEESIQRQRADIDPFNLPHGSPPLRLRIEGIIVRFQGHIQRIEPNWSRGECRETFRGCCSQTVVIDRGDRRGFGIDLDADRSIFVGIVWKLSRRVDHCRGTNGHKEITIGNGVDRLADYIFTQTVSEPHDVRAPPAGVVDPRVEGHVKLGLRLSGKFIANPPEAAMELDDPLGPCTLM